MKSLQALQVQNPTSILQFPNCLIYTNILLEKIVRKMWNTTFLSRICSNLLLLSWRYGYHQKNSLLTSTS